MSNPYKLILFDYGGVVMLFPDMDQFAHAAELTGVAREDIVAAYWRHNHLTNVQNLPWVEALLAAVREFDDSPETEAAVRATNNAYVAGKQINQPLLDKIATLKDAGYQIAILSNFTSELRTELKEQGLDTVFEHVFVSAELGHQKPQPEAFAAVFEAMQVQPAEVIFIDDTPRSLSTAEAVGYTPIQFESNEQLFAELTSLGVE